MVEITAFIYQEEIGIKYKIGDGCDAVFKPNEYTEGSKAQEGIQCICGFGAYGFNPLKPPRGKNKFGVYIISGNFIGIPKPEKLPNQHESISHSKIYYPSGINWLI